jgi:hypothetical protein
VAELTKLEEIASFISSSTHTFIIMVTSYTNQRTQPSTSSYKLNNAANEKSESKQRWKLIIKVSCKPVILGSILSTHNILKPNIRIGNLLYAFNDVLPTALLSTESIHWQTCGIEYTATTVKWLVN